jgi:hypothetical protein
MGTFSVSFGIYGNCLNAHAPAGPHDSGCNFTPVGDEDFLYWSDHRRKLIFIHQMTA